ncbi:hypothetical protein ACFVZH_11255 [Streptomyces sp. NPDC059534]|uniref:hypothetical protein n=1 Tax=Streptomyces sp. NPDC059534 TaxID=3346859 RepID=UPI0036BB8410
MAEVTNEELSIQIAGLRHHLRTPDGGWLPTTNWLKEQLGPLTELKKKIDDMHQELTKAKKTELLEGMGLDGFAAALEKYYEKSEYWGYYLGAAVASFLVPVVGLMMLTNFTNFQRTLQGAFFNLIDKIPGVNTRGRILAVNDGNTFPRLQNAQAVRAREEAAAGGLAAIPRDANYGPLRYQLQLLIPQLEKFNLHAPDFVSNFRKMPSAAKLTKTAEGVDKIGKAVTDAPDAPVMAQVAKSLGKITGAVKHANPGHITKVAKATAKLKLAVDGLDPSRIPKAAPLQGAADAARNLATNTGTLAGKLRELARTVGSLNDELGGATS